MNGEEYDKVLERLDAVRKLRNTDPEDFCKNVYEEIHIMRDYKYTDRDGNISKKNTTRYGRYRSISLDHSIQRFIDNSDKNIANSSIVDDANEILQNIYEFYQIQRAGKAKDYCDQVQRLIGYDQFRYTLLKVLCQITRLIMLLGTTIMSIALITNLFSKEVLIVISLITTAAAALDRFYKFGEQITNISIILVKLKHEFDLFTSSRGSYKKCTSGIALDMFMNNIDKLRHEKYKLHNKYEKSAQARTQEIEDALEDSKKNT